MKTVLLAFCLLTINLTSIAQTNCNIKKAYAYYTVTIPGAQMVDENGNPIPPKAQITRFIFIEYGGIKKPEIETVLYNNTLFASTLSSIKGNTVLPGDEMVINKKQKITAKKGNSLWKIDLQTEEGDNVVNLNCKNIIIKIKNNNKSCLFKLTKETELMTLPRY